MPLTREFVAPNDPVLLKIAQEVLIDQTTSPQTSQDIERMLDISYGHQKDRSKPLLVGLSAPQIGISKKIITVDIEANGKGNVGNLRVYINPKIYWKSKEQEEWYEGCWSSAKVCGIVSRPKSIRIKAYTPKGQLVDEEHHGYTARIFQHEIDHLSGHEFVDLIKDPDKLHWVEDDEWVEYRNNEAWRNWPKKCSREKWEEIKGIKKSQP